MAHALRPRGINMKLILFLLAFLFLTAPALADVFDAPCSRYRVPKPLVLAIAKTESGLDPRNNAMLGVWILANEIRRHGYTWTAVGAYHSPTPARQRMYAQVVARKYRETR